MDEVLDERKRKILKAIIKTYMETGEPVAVSYTHLAAMSQVAMLTWTFDECRGGIYRKVYGPVSYTHLSNRCAGNRI